MTGLDKISVTLYDLLGYLLPGYVLLVGCSIIESSFLASDLFALSRMSQNPVLCVVVAYFLGHMSHAMGSWIIRKGKRWFDNSGYVINAKVMKRVSQVVNETFGLDMDEAELTASDEVYLLADSYIVASGGSAERDILMARDGFFKASMAAFLLLGFTLLASLFATTRIQIRPGAFVSITRFGAALISAFIFFLAFLFRRRFIFFNCIKRNNTLRTFLALRQKSSSQDASSSKGKA